MRFTKPETLKDATTHYCPGCGHGIVHRLIAEVIDELGIREKVVGTAPVGCAVLLYDYFNCDIIECAHGRIPAVATGIKRVNPDLVVFGYTGDGDMAAIGTAEIVHAANRGENLTVIFVNNAVYGMTGGQMAPTTMLGQKTTTTQYGRDVKDEGYPLKVSEMLATLDGVGYIERCAVDNAANVIKSKNAIKKAFQNQIDGKGFSLIEVLSSCPVNWRLTPRKSNEFISKDMAKIYPLGVLKDKK
jgi:2-oxoglutarate ferredoxin oxidoreductase subunit beta|tara:strand:- start:576 stop:1307 length:732 start_codon:yes stop_codon:yes gene_type:complete